MALDLEDKSANSNTLTNSGATEHNDPMPFVQSTVAVDLELSDPDHLWAADSASLSITGDITIEGWIRLEQLPSTAGASFAISGKYDWGAAKRSYVLYIRNSDDRLMFTFSHDGTNVSDAVMDEAFDGDDVGVWIHVAVTVDVSAGASGIIFYKNGSPSADTDGNNNSTAIQDNDSKLGIGAIWNNGAVNAPFDGPMDEIRIWSGVRTAQEIADYYQTELTGAESGLAAYWPFEALEAAPPSEGLPSWKSLLGVGR